MDDIIWFFLLCLIVVFFYCKCGGCIEGYSNAFSSSSIFSCSATGCRSGKNIQGEMTEDACRRVCKSWVRKDGKCSEIEGAPWNSYASKLMCERGSQQINDGTLNTI